MCEGERVKVSAGFAGRTYNGTHNNKLAFHARADHGRYSARSARALGVIGVAGRVATSSAAVPSAPLPQTFARSFTASPSPSLSDASPEAGPRAASAAAAAAPRRCDDPPRFSSLGKRRKRGAAPSVATRPFFCRARFAPALLPNLPHSRFRRLLRTRFSSSTMRSALHASGTSSVSVSSSAVGLTAFAAALAAFFASAFVARDGRGGDTPSEGIENDSPRCAVAPLAVGPVALRSALASPALATVLALSDVVAARRSVGGSSAPPSGGERWMLTSTIVALPWSLAPAFASPLTLLLLLPPPPPLLLLLLPSRGGEPPRPKLSPLSALLAALRGAALAMRASTNSSSAKLQYPVTFPRFSCDEYALTVLKPPSQITSCRGSRPRRRCSFTVGMLSVVSIADGSHC